MGGQVIFNGQDVTKAPIHRRAQMEMDLAQEPSVFRQLSVEDNILCILESLPLSRLARKQRLTELLETSFSATRQKNCCDTFWRRTAPSSDYPVPWSPTPHFFF